MARSLEQEVRRINSNLFWCNVLLLAAALTLAGVPFFMGIGFNSDSVFCLYFAAPFGLLSLWNLFKWLLRSREPESHPFLEKVRNLGLGSLETVDRDLAQGQDFLRLTLGSSWLFSRGFFKLDLASLQDVVWAYKKESHAEYLIYCQGIAHLRNGKSLGTQSTSSAKKVEDFLEALSQAAPWVILGQNDDLGKLWAKDRQNFVAQVDQRRQTLESRRRRGETYSSTT